MSLCIFNSKLPSISLLTNDGSMLIYLHVKTYSVILYRRVILEHILMCLIAQFAFTTTTSQSEIYRRGNVENDWNSSVVRRSPSKAIIGFPIISDYFQCRKCRFPDDGPRRKCQGFWALKSSEFRKHALRNSLSMYFH